ncbi:MAG: RagB/SusD family nutrient uptake outer membrane protein [Chitinophagaceae bacterium]
MKNNVFKLAAFLVLVTGFTSCKKWLDLKPQNGIVREDFWKTKEQVAAAVTGIYASLLASPTATSTTQYTSDRPLAEYLWIWGEARADMATPGTFISPEELEMVNVNMLATNTLMNWRALYRTINYCNTVIQLAPAVIDLDPTFTKTQLDASVSEALAIRALMYFYLVRSWGDVPLKLTATISDQDIVPIPKSGQDTVLAQIVADLKKAEAGAVFTYGSKAFDKGRVTKYTVNSILADVYLWMEKYPESVAECDKVINSGQFGLLQGDASWFDKLYSQGNSNESIFEFQFDVQKLNPFYKIFVQNRRWQASFRVLDEMYTVDLVDDTKKDIRAEGSALRAADGTIWKFVASDYNSLKSQDQSFTHWFVYRYADILLMKAEALTQLDRGAEALPLVYQVRDRAAALVATDRAPATTDKNGIADFILEERAREFAFEGKRWYDILRNAKRRNYERASILYNVVANSVPSDRQQAALNKYKDKNSHYFPIYVYEIQTNKLLVQNSFYK